MRKSILPLLIALIVLFAAGGFVTWMFFFTRERQYQKVEIPPSWLETADSSRYSVQPVALWRSYPDDSIMVFFPPLENGSQVYLYDQKNYNRLLFGDHHGIPVSTPNAEGYKAVYGRPVINLSGFDTGKYYLHVTSCNYGGFFEIQLLDSLRK